MQSRSFAHATQSQDIGEISTTRYTYDLGGNSMKGVAAQALYCRKGRDESDDLQLLGRHPTDVAVTEFDLRPTREFLTDFDFQALVDDE